MGRIAEFQFLDENKDCAGSLKITFCDDCVKYTGDGLFETKELHDVSTGGTKVWEISRKSGVTLIKCDGEEVAEIDPSNDSNVLESGKSAWMKNVKFVEVSQYDEASKKYRNSPSNG